MSPNVRDSNFSNGHQEYCYKQFKPALYGGRRGKEKLLFISVSSETFYGKLFDLQCLQDHLDKRKFEIMSLMQLHPAQFSKFIVAFLQNATRSIEYSPQSVCVCVHPCVCVCFCTITQKVIDLGT